MSKKLLINRLIPEIIPVVILPAPWIVDGVAASSGTLHVRQTMSTNDIVTDVECTSARVFKDHTVLNWKDTDGLIRQDRNTVRVSPILTTPVRIGAGTSVSPTRMGSQDIGSPSGSIGPQEVRDAQPLDTAINGTYAKHRDAAPTWSKLIDRKFSNESSADVYLRCRMNLTYDR